MNLQVINRDLCVGNIKIDGVASASLVLVGDANIIQNAATFDTPAESLIIGPLVPLTPKG
ncbi:spore gernimation protein GerPD [Rossellomorea sp. BNER]|uniref:spore gernimation protein GerPD n=1 Tax=Rossellomorea sp. BNER TaxID=2962031 RepID=UPI003AF1ECD6|nr:spore gernimation protein GerPD [Rossellomorea sp. BNER]